MSYYLYAFVAPNSPIALDNKGVAQTNLELQTHQDLAALIEKIPEGFQAELEANAQNPAWLAEKALRHNEIIEAYLGVGVLPLRFGTILSTQEAITALLEQSQGLAKRLAAVRGKAEYAVRVWADKTVLTPRLIDSDENLDDLSVQLGSTSGGKAYMLQKRLQDGVERLFSQQLPTYRSIAFGQLADLVDQLVALPRTPKNTEQRFGLLEAAVLLEPRAALLLPAELESWAERYGFVVELSGPFAPYNFVEDPDENGGQS